MIYFSPEVNRRLIGRFHQSLKDCGWLVVGAAEHNLEDYNAFSAVDAAGAKLYQKRTVQCKPLEPVRPWPAPVRKPRAPPAAPKATLDIENLRQFADRGDWESGSEYGRRLLAQDRLNPEIHFYLALIFEDLAIVGEPERSLRQALYLDRNFALAHYHLGLSLKRAGEIAGAARSFGNVLKVLNRMPDAAAVTAGRGITAIGLKKLAKMHLGTSNLT
jgi:chemotaxis protein methyltransferase CheR